MTDPKATEPFAEWNDRMAHLYDPDDYHLRSGWVVRWIEGRRVDAAIRLLAARDGERILEVGCGAGNLLEKVGAGWLAGIDLSSYLLDKSRRRLQNRAVLAGADAEHLPFKSGSFDAVLCSEVLEHVMSPERVLAEMVRVSRSGGRIVLTVPNEPLIDWLKGILGSTRILSWLGKGKQYKVKSNHLEWHLHSLDLGRTLAMIPSGARVTRTVAVPSVLVPLRHAILLGVQGGR